MKAVFLIVCLVHILRNCLLYYLKHNYIGRYTLGDMSMQHVHFAATNHSVCTGRAISCCNKLRDTLQRQFGSCVLRKSGDFLLESLSSQKVARAQSDLIL